MKDNYLLPLYRRFPVTFTHGEGVLLFDDTGRPYWDFLAGIAVNSLGYNHLKIQEALEASARLTHISNLFWHEPGMELSQKMADITGGYYSLWVNSGTEANEAGIKLMRAYGQETGRRAILSFSGAFHGRTFGSLSATPTPSYQDPFKPLLPEFYSIPYGDVDALQNALDQYQPCGVLFESIQGEGGVVDPPAGFLHAAVELCHAHDTLVLFDEVQTGAGRTGRWFGFQWDNVTPDMITVAKGIGGGVPIGGMLVHPKWMGTLLPGQHGTTFGGNLLASRAALAVVDWLASGGLEHIQRVSAYLEQTLQRMQRDFPAAIKQVRGRGLLRGIQINGDASYVVSRALEEGLIINSPRPDVIRIAPPLIVDEEAIDAFETIFSGVLSEV